MYEDLALPSEETLESDDDDSFEVDEELEDAYYQAVFAAIDDTPEFTNLWEYYFNGDSYTESSTSTTEDLDIDEPTSRLKRPRDESWKVIQPPPPRKKSRTETIVLDDN